MTGCATFKGHGRCPLLIPLSYEVKTRANLALSRSSLLFSSFSLSLYPRLFLPCERCRRLAPADTWTKIYVDRDFATRGSLQFIPSANRPLPWRQSREPRRGDGYARRTPRECTIMRHLPCCVFRQNSFGDK